MTVAVRPAVRLFALVPALVAAGSIVVDFMLLDFYGVAIVLMVSLLAYVVVGLLLVVRLPRQPVGWLLLWAGAFLQLATAAGAYGWAALIRAPGTLPLGEVALVLSWGWIPALGCMFVAVMLFPTGRPPSPRWRPAVALIVISTSLLLVAALFSQQDLQVPQSLGAQNAPLFKVPNPLAIGGALGALLSYGYASPFAFVVYLIPVAAVLARFRTTVGSERQQLKWFAYASSVGLSFFVLAGLVPALFSYLSGLGPALAIIAIDLIPISVAIAILRYRLYEIDLLIKRTLVYGATTAAIAATFWVGILALQRLLSPLTSGSDVAIAASTLVSLALFQPVRHWVQDAVDRRFDRSRYNAARTVDAFADVLRDEVDLDEVRADLIGSVQQTMSPAHTSLWLRESAR